MKRNISRRSAATRAELVAFAGHSPSISSCHTSLYSRVDVDGRVDPLRRVGRVVKSGRSDQDRPAGGHGIDGAERAFLHAGADDDRGQPDQLVDVGGNDGFGVGRQCSIGGEQLRVLGGPAAFDGDQGVEELPQPLWGRARQGGDCS